MNFIKINGYLYTCKTLYNKIITYLNEGIGIIFDDYIAYKNDLHFSPFHRDNNQTW